MIEFLLTYGALWLVVGFLFGMFFMWLFSRKDDK